MAVGKNQAYNVSDTVPLWYYVASFSKICSSAVYCYQTVINKNYVLVMFACVSANDPECEEE